jgi:hypothetical protein
VDEQRSAPLLAYVPFDVSWMKRIEAQFTGLRSFALDGTDHPDHAAQARVIRRYIAWRNAQRPRPPPAPRRRQPTPSTRR